jgi:lipooligosaccharide transport system permease protein
VPFIAFLTGFGWSCFGILIAAVLKSIDNFNYVTSTVITPLFLTAGTFFPISGLPEWAQVAANLNPLYHCVQLVRDAVFGLKWVDLWHVSFLLVFGLVMWRLAIARMERKLID